MLNDRIPERALEPPDTYRDTSPQPESVREENLEYCFDHMREFIEFAESYVPGIVDEFCSRFPWQYKKWLVAGCVIKIGGSC